MVGTLGSTLEFSGPAFDAAVQRAVDVLLPGLTTRLTNEIRQNSVGGSGDQPPTIHTWSEQQKYEREYHTIHQRDGKTSGEFMKRFLRLAGFVGKKAGPPEEHAKHFKWALCDWILDGILNTEFTDVAQVANAARNIEILRERQGGNSNQKSWQNRGQQYNCSSRSSGQKGYLDYASSPPCDTCGKLHPGKACHRVTGACFTCGSTSIWQGIALRMVETVVREMGTTINLLLRGEYFLRPRIRHLTLQVPFRELFLFLFTPLDFVLSISTPMGNNVVLGLEFRSCPLRFDDKIRFANLLPLEMSDFDIILGMDWLTEHRATIDCHTKRVIFGDLNNYQT
ncbi:putative reverse transcriptase domain-containing protein [Tanacetum coccineum]